MVGCSDKKQKFRYSIAKNLPKIATNKERYLRRNRAYSSRVTIWWSGGGRPPRGMVLSVVGALALAPSCASRLWAAACSRGTNERSARSAIRRAHRQAPQQRVRPRGHSRPPRASRARRIRLLSRVPRGGPSEEVRSPALRSLFLTTSAVPGAEIVPVARRRKASRVKLGKAGTYIRPLVLS